MTGQPKLCAFDIETRGQVPEFVCGAIVSDETTEWFDEPDRMVECLRTHARKGYTLVAHKAEYDTTILLWGRGEDVRIEYISGQYACAYWKWDGKKRVCPIWDSLRLSAGLSLEDVGKAIHLEKYPMPRKLADPDDWRKDWVCDAHNSAGCVQCYNCRDAEITWGYVNMMREWMDGYGIRLQRSIPRMAMELWKYFDPKQQQTIRSKDLKEFCRLAYHSGRCEVITYGAVGRTYTHDIRSFYGSILANVGLPDLSTLCYQASMGRNQIPEIGDGVIEADVYVEPCNVPCLPALSCGRVYYPVGTIHGVWPVSELRYALTTGVQLLKVYRTAYSDNVHQRFQQTALAMLELRDEFIHRGDPRSVLPKFILNSIVGRLGLRDSADRVSYRRWVRGMGRQDMRGCELETVGDQVFLATSSPIMKPSPTSNVLWAAIINGYGRSRIYPYLLEAGDSLVYTDTDSVHSLRPLSTGPDVAGSLRETGTYDRGLYLAPKFYRLERYDGTGEVRAKGVPRRYADTYIATGGAAFQTTLSVVQSIQRGVSPGTWVDVERTSQFSPGARTILLPEVIGDHQRSSPTRPVVFSLEGSTDNLMTND